jgi:tetratricopeptide (TPR) repeat protein
MYWLSRLLILLTISSALPIVASAQTSRDGAISGRLLFDGAVSCDRVVVELERVENQAIDFTLADMGCGFRFDRIAKGNYFVHVKVDGYSDVRQAVDVADGGLSAAPLIITMSPAPTRISRQRSGNIVDASELLEQYPRKAVDLYKKSISDRKKGRRDKAIEDLEQAVKIAPNFYQAQNDLGVLYSMMNRPEDAEKHLVQAHELNRNSTEPLINLASLYLDQDKPDRAEEVSQEAVRNDSKSGPALFNLGIALYKLARLDKAEDALMKALQVAPKMFQVHLALANVYMKLRQYDRMVAQLNSYLDQNPNGPEREQVEKLRDQAIKARQDER